MLSASYLKKYGSPVDLGPAPSAATWGRSRESVIGWVALIRGMIGVCSECAPEEVDGVGRAPWGVKRPSDRLLCIIFIIRELLYGYWIWSRATSFYMRLASMY
jgi:hypothetical protein